MITRKPLRWLTICLVLSFFLLAYPIYVIRPFRYQGSHELAVALVVMRWRPLLESICVVAAVGIGIMSWRNLHGVMRKTALILCTLLVVTCGYLSRINIYELMFHPIDRATFSNASGAKLDKKEEILAVNVRGAARAYPVRILSYHHIINDDLGGEPIVATY